MITVILAAAAIQTTAPPPRSVVASGPIEQVEIGPVYRLPFACVEHPEGQLPYVGDALGTDCMVIGSPRPEGDDFFRLYATDGRTNADWYGWRADVLAAFDGVVDKITANDVENIPGKLGKAPAATIVIRWSDGVRVLLAHVAEVRVKAGEAVVAGQTVAVVGNNGYARAPHIHVGAFREKTPLQIRWDLRAMARIQNVKPQG